MSYQGEDFPNQNGTVSVRVYDDGQVQVNEYGHGKLSEEDGAKLAEFIMDKLHQVRKARGDFDRDW